MSNPDPFYHIDAEHDLSLCQNDAAVDAWESNWELLRNQLMVAVVKSGFETKGVAAILEKASADIIDLVEAKHE